jgi:hypothetical protein
MKTNTSLARVEANRENAAKSTGPKTRRGKAAARLNAVRHGILAREVVLRGLRGVEQRPEYESVQERFWEHLKPVGPVEELLVERMVTTYWRWRRVLVAERGEIADEMRGVTRRMKREERSSIRSALWGSEPELSAASVRFVIAKLQSTRQSVEDDDGLTEAALQRLAEACGGRPQYVLTGLRSTLPGGGDYPEDVPEEQRKEDRRERALRILDNALATYQRELPALEKREGDEAEARRDASLLPRTEVVEKILRYESSLERQFYRALNQLERLQRRRNGETVPPPLMMDMSL